MLRALRYWKPRQHKRLRAERALQILLAIVSQPFAGAHLFIYYAALLPRRGPHIASHSVCPSVCLSVRPVIVTERHVAPPSELQ